MPLKRVLERWSLEMQWNNFSLIKLDRDRLYKLGMFNTLRIYLRRKLTKKWRMKKIKINKTNLIQMMKILMKI